VRKHDSEKNKIQTISAKQSSSFIQIYAIYATSVQKVFCTVLWTSHGNHQRFYLPRDRGRCDQWTGYDHSPVCLGVRVYRSLILYFSENY
jgi:hypothetical protein